VAAFAGVVGGGALSGGQLAHGLQAVMGAANPTTGVLSQGSPDVRVNGRPAVRAGLDYVASCSGLLSTHHFPKPMARVAEGSRTVRVNGRPFARVAARLECAAAITAGSPNVRVGGPTEAVLAVQDTEATATKAATVMMLLGIGAAAPLVAVAGTVALVEFVAVGAAFSAVNAGLGWVGDQLGPGWADVLQGGAGIAALVAGPRGMRASEQRAIAGRVKANLAEGAAARATSNFGKPASPPPGPNVIRRIPLGPAQDGAAPGTATFMRRGDRLPSTRRGAPT